MEEMREKYLINNKKIIIISSTNEIQEIKLVIQIKILLVDPASGTNNCLRPRLNYCQFKSWTTFGFKM